MCTCVLFLGLIYTPETTRLLGCGVAKANVSVINYGEVIKMCVLLLNCPHRETSGNIQNSSSDLCIHTVHLINILYMLWSL